MLFFAQISVAQNEPGTVPEFSLARYMGTWYQIAFIPNRFQAFCVSEPSAEYSLLSPGRISIINACRDRDGVLRVAEGQGRLNKKYFDTRSIAGPVLHLRGSAFYRRYGAITGCWT